MVQVLLPGSEWVTQPIRVWIGCFEAVLRRCCACHSDCLTFTSRVLDPCVGATKPISPVPFAGGFHVNLFFLFFVFFLNNCSLLLNAEP